MRHEIIRLGRNFLLSLGGEGLQSGLHFALNLALIRFLSPHDYGVFAIALILGGIALTYGNALVSTPATVFMPRLKSPGAVDFQDVVFGSVAVVIAAGIAVIVAVGLYLSVGQLAEAIAGGAFIGLWTLRNHVRCTMFARRTMAAATLSDFSYSASGIVFVGGVLWRLPGLPQLTGVLLALIGANVVAILVALLASRRRVRVSLRRGVRRRYRAIWSEVVWSLVGTTTWVIQAQGLTFLVASIVGPAAYAPLAAGAVLFTPLRPAVAAFINVFRPTFAVALARGQIYRLRVAMYATAALIMLGCIGAGGAIWLGWSLLDIYVFAGKFADAPMPLIVGLSGCAAAVYFTYSVPLSVIQAAGAFRPVALATMSGALVGLTSVSVLLAVTSVAWSLAGFIAGEATCAVCLWIAAQRMLRKQTATTATGAVALGEAAELRA